MTGGAALTPQAEKTLARWYEILRSGATDELGELAADDIVFRSPAFFSPYPGRDAFVLIISTVKNIFEDFTYHRQFATADGESVVLEFSARIGDLRLKGIDMIRFNRRGEIAEFEVMIRPGNALMSLGKIMAERAGPKLAMLKMAGE